MTTAESDALKTGDAVTFDQPADPTPRQLCALALKQGAAIDVIERFSALAERWDAIEAKKRWTEAIVGFKADCPPILKTSEVLDRGGKLLYKFVPYDDIKAVTLKWERKWGIVVGFTMPVTNAGNLTGDIRITVGSHTEVFSGGVPIPTAAAGGINAAQLMGQARSYLKRYLYVDAFDLVIAREDSDATGLFERITPDQVGKIHELTDAFEKLKVPHNHKAFLKMFGVPEDGNTGDLAPDQFVSAMRGLYAKLPANHPLKLKPEAK